MDWHIGCTQGSFNKFFSLEWIYPWCETIWSTSTNPFSDEIKLMKIVTFLLRPIFSPILLGFVSFSFSWDPSFPGPALRSVFVELVFFWGSVFDRCRLISEKKSGSGSKFESWILRSLGLIRGALWGLGLIRWNGIVWLLELEGWIIELLSKSICKERESIQNKGLIKLTLSWGTQTCSSQQTNGSTLIGDPKHAIARMGPGIQSLHPWYPILVMHQPSLD